MAVEKTTEQSNKQSKKSRQDNKDELFWNVLDSAVALEVRHGHLKWKMSDLSRRSKVSRPLVYYYFGKDRRQILVEAIRMFGDELAGLSDKRIKYWDKGDIYTSVLASRDLCERLPHFVSFYFSHRGLTTDIGDLIRQIEDRYLKKIKRYLSKTTPDQGRAVFGFLFGLTFAPGLNKSAVAEGVRMIERYR